MKLPVGTIRAIALYSGPIHKGNYGRTRLEKACNLFNKSGDPNLEAIVWFASNKPAQVFKNGVWSVYEGPIRPPVLKKGKPSNGGGKTNYIPERISTIVDALKVAPDQDLEAVERFLIGKTSNKNHV